MSSPAISLYTKCIQIDRRKSTPLYLQVVYQFIQAIQRQLLEEGDQLPGSRPLSRALGIHRKTLIAALEELETQGWVQSVPAVGTYIKNPEHLPKKGKNSLQAALPDTSGFNYRKSFLLDATPSSFADKLKFTDGTPDYRILKPTELGRFYSSLLKRKNNLQNRLDPAGRNTGFFYEQLSFYLNTTRGFHCSKNHLLITESRQVLLYILTQLLIQKGDLVLVEEYGYPLANMIFQQAGAQLHTIPIDQEGIQVDHIAQQYRAGQIRLLFIQPQHQYPTTSCLSAQRRHKLIKLATELDFIIVEDEEFSELTYEKSTPLSLIKHAHQGKLIHLGSFGKFLLPGFQANFMLGPKDFITEAHKYLPIFNPPDPLKDRARGEMIDEGDIHRYRRKAIQAYTARRNLFSALLLQQELSEIFQYTPPKGGWAFWLKVKQPFSLSKLVENCRTKGLLIPRVCLYQNRTITALRLGFGHLNEREMKESIHLLHQALRTSAQKINDPLSK